MAPSFKSLGSNDVSQTDNPLQAVPKKKRGWLIVYGLYGFLAITAVTLGTLYRVLPKRSEVLAKRKAKPEYSSYALILSPLGTKEAEEIAHEICDDIGSDSIATKMVITGTSFHKQCTSLAEYGKIIKESTVHAAKPDIGTQAQLTDKMLNIMITDKILAQFYIIGNFGTAKYNDIEKSILPVFNGITLRSQTIGKVQVFDYIKGGDSTTNRRFVEYLKNQGFMVKER